MEEHLDNNGMKRKVTQAIFGLSRQGNMKSIPQCLKATDSNCLPTPYSPGTVCWCFVHLDSQPSWDREPSSCDTNCFVDSTPPCKISLITTTHIALIALNAQCRKCILPNLIHSWLPSFYGLIVFIFTLYKKTTKVLGTP